MAPKLHFGQEAILIHADNTHLLVGNGPSFMDVEIAATIKPDGTEEKKTIKNTTIYKKKEGVVVQHQDVIISYVNAEVSAKKAKEYQANVLILTKPQEKLIEKIKPKLVVIMNSNVYAARELNKKTGLQVIAAQQGTTIDLDDYSALSKQKALSKFIEEK